MITWIQHSRSWKHLSLKVSQNSLAVLWRDLSAIVHANTSKQVPPTCLLQSSKPITFALKSLTDAETQNANIKGVISCSLCMWVPPYLPVCPQASADDCPQEYNYHTPLSSMNASQSYNSMIPQLDPGLAVKFNSQIPCLGSPASSKEMKFYWISL